MNNKEDHPYQNWLEDPNLSEALDKIIQESRERLKQKRYHQNKNNDIGQNYNRRDSQNDNINSDDYSYYDYIVFSCE